MKCVSLLMYDKLITDGGSCISIEPTVQVSCPYIMWFSHFIVYLSFRGWEDGGEQEQSSVLVRLINS